MYRNKYKKFTFYNIMIQDSSISQLIDRVTQSPVYPITKQIVVMDASGS